MTNLKEGQRIDVYNIKEGHHALSKNQSVLAITDRGVADVYYGNLLNGYTLNQRHNYQVSLFEGEQCNPKVGTFIVKSLKGGEP